MDGESGDDGRDEFTWVGWEECEGEWIGCEVDGWRYWAAISDYPLVTCHLPVAIESPPLAKRLVRVWRRVNRDELHRADLTVKEDSELWTAPADVDQLFKTYNTVLHSIVDQFLTLRVICRLIDVICCYFVIVNF